MTEEASVGKIAPELNQVSPVAVPPSTENSLNKTAATNAPRPLTAEEQMALYEDDLRENDWGHQPC